MLGYISLVLAAVMPAYLVTSVCLGDRYTKFQTIALTLVFCSTTVSACYNAFFSQRYYYRCFYLA